MTDLEPQPQIRACGGGRKLATTLPPTLPNLNLTTMRPGIGSGGLAWNSYPTADVFIPCRPGGDVACHVDLVVVEPKPRASQKRSLRDPGQSNPQLIGCLAFCACWGASTALELHIDSLHFTLCVGTWNSWEFCLDPDHMQSCYVTLHDPHRTE